MRKTVCLDFNGVLDDYVGWVNGGIGTEYAPKQGLRTFLQSMTEDYDVVICTVIKPAHVQAWLSKYDLAQYIKQVTNTKPIASIYVDDRAVCFDGDYDALLIKIKAFKPYWEQ